MNISKLIIGAILLVIFVLEPLYIICIFEDRYERECPLKTTIGDTNDSLVYPWGTAPNISVYLDLDNMSIEERNNYVQIALDSMDWWEKDTKHNLSYPVKFRLVNNSDDANIILSWVNNVSTNPADRGYTHINSSGREDSLGKNLCDTYNPPYSRCVIEIGIRTNPSYGDTLHTVKHELGHALGLMHRFNIWDFYITGFERHLNYDFEDSEIMFDYSIYNCSKTVYERWTIF